MNNKESDEKLITNRKNYTSHIACHPETKEKLEINCVRIFKEHNPKFEGLKIPAWFILKKIVEYYEKN